MQEKCFGKLYMCIKECMGCNVHISCANETHTLQNYERVTELTKLKYKLQKDIIMLVSKESHIRHLERMEFLVYRDKGKMTKKTELELEDIPLIENKSDKK